MSSQQAAQMEMLPSDRYVNAIRVGKDASFLPIVLQLLDAKVRQ